LRKRGQRGELDGLALVAAGALAVDVEVGADGDAGVGGRGRTDDERSGEAGGHEDLLEHGCLPGQSIRVPRRSEPENAEETDAGQAPYALVSNFCDRRHVDAVQAPG